MGSAGGDTHRDALPRCHRIPGLKGSELPPDFRGDVDNPSLVKMLLNAIEVGGIQSFSWFLIIAFPYTKRCCRD
jgi:hypothetical protein